MKPLLLCLALMMLHFHLRAQIDTNLKEIEIKAVKSTVKNNSDKLIYDVATSVTAMGSDALNALSKVPGVKISDGQVGIAGKGNVRVMINDRLVQLSGIELTRYLKSIPAGQISRIELIKNPGANYDAEGNAGLINIITKKSSQQGYAVNLQTSGKRWFHNPAKVYGTRNFQGLNAAGDISYNSEKLTARASVNLDRGRLLEGFRTDFSYPKQIWMQSDTGDYKYRMLNYEAGLDYKISTKTSIGFSYTGGKNIYDGNDHVNNTFTNPGTALRDSSIKAFATYYPVARINAVNLHSIINFDTSGRKLILNADYFNHYRTDVSDFESNSFKSDGSPDPSGRTRFYDTNKQQIRIYTFKADASIPTHFAQFDFGGKLSFIDNYSNAFYYYKTAQDELIFNPGLSNEFDYTENTQSLYASMNIDHQQWKYKIGLRSELTQTKGYSHVLKQNTINNYFKLFPSVSINYQPTAEQSLSFNFGRRINRPTFWNLNPYKSLYTAYSYGQGNPFLQPEYNNNFELLHSYKNILSSSLFFNMTENGFSNVILADANTNIVYTTPLNFIKTYRYGISENLSLPLASWLDNNNQVTFSYTQAKSKLSNIEGVNGFGLYLATNNNIFLNQEKTLAAAVNFWYQFPEVDRISRTNAYYKLDLGLKAAILKKKVDLALTLNDLFLSSAPVITTTVNNIRQKFTNFQMNRYALLSLSYRFGNSGAKSSDKNTGNAEERSRAR
ncbi:TonB-dependent receptor domain-containing protein [Pedobacter nyackensis]|uniref:TonB-dependent receptor domain-containing protein n=1 Tax=Pedobacter nyackensis TaxID=475255 RepID=UPI00292E73A9|nr:TonB-dependent receptor [Pedobacter nyackensis]